MVRQHLSVEPESGDYNVDSFAIGLNAEAIELLAKYGKIEITGKFGRRVLGKWKEDASV
jgi:hypothetical protein